MFPSIHLFMCIIFLYFQCSKNNTNVSLQKAEQLTTEELLCKGSSVRSIGTEADFPIPPQSSKQLKTQGTQTNDNYFEPCTVDKGNVFCMEDANGSPLNHITIQTVTKDEQRSIYDPPPGTPIIIKINKRKLFPCGLCDKVLSAYSLLGKHMKICHSNGEQLPSTMESSCATDGMDDVDVTTVDPSSNDPVFQPVKNTTQCFQCNKMLPSMEACDEHFTVHYDDMFCNSCNRTFGCKKTYRDHLATHFGVKHKCKTCSRKYVIKVGLLRHIKNFHPLVWNDTMRADLNRLENPTDDNSNFTAGKEVSTSTSCDGCGLDFASFSDLEKHKKSCPKSQPIHESNNKAVSSVRYSSHPYWCKSCELSFKTKKTYRRHTNYSQIHKNNQMAFNSKKSQGQKVVKQSSSNTSKGSKITYRCSGCNSSFKDHDSLKWHKKFQCSSNTNKNIDKKTNNKIDKNIDKIKIDKNIDNNNIDNNITIKKTKKITNKINKCFCVVCSAESKNRVQLCKHMMTHISPTASGEFQCNQCPKRFQHKERLEGHLYYHLSMFMCSRCNKKFIKLKDLKKHIKSEHKSKNLSSQNLLQQSNKRMSSLDSNHGMDDHEDMHLCKFCGKSFYHFTHRRQHQKQCEKKNHPTTATASSNNQTVQVLQSSSQASTNTQDVDNNLDIMIKKEKQGDTNTPPIQDLKMQTNGATSQETIDSENTSQNEYPNLRERKSLNSSVINPQETASVTKENNFPCRRCNELFPTRYALMRHQELSKHGDQHKKLKKRYKCQVCKKTFQLYSVYYHHQLQHNMKHKYTCRMCGTGCATFKALSLHKCSKSIITTGSNGAKQYRCHMCEATFSSGQGLSNHRRSHMTRERNQRECNCCNRVFENEMRLKKHRRTEGHSQNILKQKNNETVNEERLFECGQCGKFFSTNKSLRRHSNNSVCQAASSTKSTTSPIACQHCTQQFDNYTNFEMHHNADHSTGKPCWLCNKDFSSCGNLNRHIKEMHKDAKQFICYYCSKQFDTLSLYTVHTSHSWGEKRHKCPHCALTFTLCLYLTEHINSSHKS